MKSAALAWGILALALPLPALAGPAGIEIVGLGEQGASLRYVSGPEVTVRFRVRGRAGEPMNVLLRRDDGATTVVANVPGDGSIRTARVAVKPERWTLSEFQAFAFEPASGTIHRGKTAHAVVQTGPESQAAAALQRARVRREAPESFDADLVAGLDLDTTSAALE